MKIKRFATIGVIIVALLSMVFFLVYEDYKYTFHREDEINKSFDAARTELNRSIYKALDREAQVKTDRIASGIRGSLLRVYDGDMEQFEKDYDKPVEGSILIDIIDDISSVDYAISDSIIAESYHRLLKKA